MELGQQSRAQTVLIASALNIAVKCICSGPVQADARSLSKLNHTWWRTPDLLPSVGWNLWKAAHLTTSLSVKSQQLGQWPALQHKVELRGPFKVMWGLVLIIDNRYKYYISNLILIWSEHNFLSHTDNNSQAYILTSLYKCGDFHLWILLRVDFVLEKMMLYSNRNRFLSGKCVPNSKKSKLVKLTLDPRGLKEKQTLL